MTPQQYERLTELFHAATEVTPDQCAAYLDQVCDGDAELRRELESLLAAHDERAAYTQMPPADIAAGLYQAQQDRGANGLPHLLLTLESTAMRYARCSPKEAWVKFIWPRIYASIAKSR